MKKMIGASLFAVVAVTLCAGADAKGAVLDSAKNVSLSYRELSTKSTVGCGLDPKNQGVDPRCQTALEWCFEYCYAEYEAVAAVCSSLGWTPQAAICHAANSVVHANCRLDCRENN